MVFIIASKILSELSKPKKILGFDAGELAKIDDRKEMEKLLMSLIEDGNGIISFYELEEGNLHLRRINFMREGEFREEAARNFVDNYTKVYFHTIERDEIESLEEKKVLARQVLITAYNLIGDEEISELKQSGADYIG